MQVKPAVRLLMKINERYISDVQNYEEGLRAIEELCVCGHPLKAHAYVTLPYTYFHNFPDNVYPSQCVACGISHNEFVCSHWRSLTMLAPDKGQAAVVKDNQVFAPCG